MSGQGRVRWSRFALIFLPSAAAAAALLYATMEDAIGASFVVAGKHIKFTAEEVRAWDIGQFDTTLETKNGEPIPVHVITNGRAESRNTCQSYLFDTPIGPATFRVVAATGKEPTRIKNQVIYALSLDNGPTRFTNDVIGLDASTVSTVPQISGPPGNVGEHSATVVAHNTKQILIATSAEDLNIPDSSLRVLLGKHECF